MAPQTLQRMGPSLALSDLLPLRAAPGGKGGISTCPSPLDPEGQDHHERATGWAQPDSASVQVDLMMLVAPFRSSLSSACGFFASEVPVMDPSREISAQWVQLA